MAPGSAAETVIEEEQDTYTKMVADIEETMVGVVDMEACLDDA